MVATGAKRDYARRHGKQVAVCGEAASDPVAAGLLIGLGVDELSLSPARIPAIKSMVRTVNSSDLQALAGRGINLASTAEVRSLADRAPPVEIPA